MSSKHPSLSTQVLFSTTLPQTIIFHSWAQPSYWATIQGKKVKAHTSQRPRRPELIPVSLDGAYLGVLLLPPGWYASPLQGYPQQFVTGTHLYPWVKRDKLE